MAGSFCYSLAKSKRFCTFDTTAWRTKVKRSAEGHGLHPFFGPSWSKKFTAFFGPLLWSRKNRREQRTEKLLHAIFACPYFANKIISAALKLSAKMVFARRTNQRAICPRITQTKKRAYNSLLSLF